jgi:predicted Rossmann fold flavoprotein
VIVGAGAAGLATAIFTRRAGGLRRVAILDGAKKPGAKILVSGGARCNVTNTIVSERDFWGGRAPIVRRVLRAFPVADTIAFFRELGVTLHEEADGKLFPDSNRARDVLDALLVGTARSGAALLASHRVTRVEPSGGGFRIATSAGELRADAVVLATGGQSLPKSGSDGAGFAIATRLGHTIVPTTPALAPLLLDPDDRLHRDLSGVSHDVEIAVWIDGVIATRIGGALLWTHFGVSGPAALNASRHWMRATLEGRAVAATVNLHPGHSFEDVDSWWTARARGHPRASAHSTLAERLPASLAAALLARLRIDATTPLAHFAREDRRRLVHALVAWPLPVIGTRGYNYAEATAGGVALDEIDPATMASRVCRGLHLVGEILDVDGRIGGFNFQWAWSTAFVAGRALGGEAAGAAPAAD